MTIGYLYCTQFQENTAVIWNLNGKYWEIALEDLPLYQNFAVKISNSFQIDQALLLISLGLPKEEIEEILNE